MQWLIFLSGHSAFKLFLLFVNFSKLFGFDRHDNWLRENKIIFALQMNSESEIDEISRKVFYSPGLSLMIVYAI